MHITEQQLQEIAGRLNAITVQGLTNMGHVLAITNVLEQIAQTAKSENVVNFEKEAV